MIPWMRHILGPPSSETEHPGDQTLAGFAEGTLDPAQRETVVAHLNRCRQCHRIVVETLTDLEGEARGLPHTPYPWTKSLSALAAGFLIAVVIGYNFLTGPASLSASLALDPQLQAVLMEDGALRWDQGPRLQRLAALLQQRGLKTKDLKQVVLTQPYTPTKDFRAPPEQLQIRIEDGVAYLTITSLDPQPPAQTRKEP